MTAAAHRRDLMSLDDWRALGEDPSQRYEVQEGVLIVSPRPRQRHQNVMLALGSRLLQQRPAGVRVTPEPDVIIDPRTPATVRIPDLVICRGDEDATLTAADVLIAIEVLSPGTRRVDLVMKRSEYADAGIEHYWIVDPDERYMEVLTLIDGAYVGRRVEGVFTTSVPFDVTIDLDDLG
ncbi:Uma2 family endonuclease [Tsukamurella sp. NPDC003166]|uniref:Uma2 family endonuclease n=1 Tax=Tsukamurella sp. NPDC003166 TaxID=3154444 RepID=UPI0033AD757B